MAKYRTTDIHVIYGPKTIPPETEVEVEDAHVSQWEELVSMHLAERVTTKPKKEEEPEEPEGPPQEGQDPPVPAAKSAKK